MFHRRRIILRPFILVIWLELDQIGVDPSDGDVSDIDILNVTTAVPVGLEIESLFCVNNVAILDKNVPDATGNLTPDAYPVG